MSCPRIRIETRHPRRPIDLATYKSISLRSVEPDCDPWDIPKWGFPRGTWGDCETDELGDKEKGSRAHELHLQFLLSSKSWRTLLVQIREQK